MHIITPARENAQRYWNLLNALDHETEFMMYEPGERTQNLARHSAYIVCGIREKYRRKGLGTQFFHLLDEWAKEQKIHRLELTVLCENAAALALYQKSGFEIEGTARHTMRVRGVYKDEYHMSKIIPEAT